MQCNNHWHLVDDSTDPLCLVPVLNQLVIGLSKIAVSNVETSDSLVDKFVH